MGIIEQELTAPRADFYDRDKVTLPPKEEDEGEIQSFTDALSGEGDATDVQSAIVRLFPHLKGDTVAKLAMVSRIAPEVFLSALRLKTVNDIRKSPTTEAINTIDTLLTNYLALAIGLDGKGRLDMIELAGASAAEDAELQADTNKLLGLE